MQSDDLILTMSNEYLAKLRNYLRVYLEIFGFGYKNGGHFAWPPIF